MSRTLALMERGALRAYTHEGRACGLIRADAIVVGDELLGHGIVCDAESKRHRTYLRCDDGEGEQSIDVLRNCYLIATRLAT